MESLGRRVVPLRWRCHVLVFLLSAAYPTQPDSPNTLERYDVIEPHLLIGGQQRPVSLINSMVSHW